MAENKKSFLIYCDIINTIDHLTDEEKGRLFQHLLEYVNDMNPILEDRILLSVWKPIQQQLKRDLKKWEDTREKRSFAGKKSAEKRKQNQQVLTNVESVEHTITNSTVNDNVNVNVNVNENDIIVNIDKKETNNKFTPEKFLQWFNKGRISKGFKESKFNRLSFKDKENLEELIKIHNGDDFLKAFSVFIKDEWILKHNLATPTHFLKIENFEKYLNTESKELTLGQKLMGKM